MHYQPVVWVKIENYRLHINLGRFELMQENGAIKFDRPYISSPKSTSETSMSSNIAPETLVARLDVENIGIPVTLEYCLLLNLTEVRLVESYDSNDKLGFLFMMLFFDLEPKKGSPPDQDTKSNS